MAFHDVAAFSKQIEHFNGANRIQTMVLLPRVKQAKVKFSRTSHFMYLLHSEPSETNQCRSCLTFSNAFSRCFGRSLSTVCDRIASISAGFTLSCFSFFRRHNAGQ